MIEYLSTSLKILREISYLPSMIFCTENPYSKLFLVRTFLIVNGFSNFANFAKKIFSYS